MKNLVISFLLILSSGLMTACDDDDDRDLSSSQGESSVRAVHASPDAPSVDVLVNNDVVLEDVAYTQSSEYLAVPYGTNNIKVNAAGTDTSVIDADVNLAADSDYTVIAINFLDMISPLVLEDDNTEPDEGIIKIRVVHAAPSAPNVDVYVTSAAAELDSVEPVLQDVPFGIASNYLEVPAADYRIRVTVTGTTDVAIDTGEVPLSFFSGQIRTVVALDADGGGAPFSAIILEDLN